MWVRQGFSWVHSFIANAALREIGGLVVFVRRGLWAQRHRSIFSSTRTSCALAKGWIIVITVIGYGSSYFAPYGFFPRSVAGATERARVRQDRGGECRGKSPSAPPPGPQGWYRAFRNLATAPEVGIERRDILQSKCRIRSLEGLLRLPF